ncbi:sulfur transferase domain-containing protein [Leisingera sp. F5]|uniref:beta-lactamase hydrolase domain-containing protein n=1 Tax=Leisingera sp. F5 TaxID=1813816 RepID=UPI000B12DACB|nr:sulfur transferase domain-containing protein [Leisingera sp. F5]
MELKEISDGFVSPQVFPEDLAILKDAGIRTVICNRLDSATANQPSYKEIQIAAKAAELEVR